MSDEHDRPTPVIREDIVPWMAALAGAVRVGLAGLTRVRVEGAIDEIPRTGPVIIAANHSSNLDVPVLGSSLMPRISMSANKRHFFRRLCPVVSGYRYSCRPQLLQVASRWREASRWSCSSQAHP